MKQQQEDCLTSQNHRHSEATEIGRDLLGTDLPKMISVLRAEKAQIDEAIRALERVKAGQAGRSNRPLRLERC
jgi:hypothetical protein